MTHASLPAMLFNYEIDDPNILQSPFTSDQNCRVPESCKPGTG